MIVSYQGQSSFKVSQGDLSISINPQSKTAADITLFNAGRWETSEKSGFVIDGPGEYEVKNVSIKGFLSRSEDGMINTIYVVNLEGINLCFLGSPADTDLSEKTLEELENINILFVPVNAHKLAVSLEPNIIIPTQFSNDSLKKFVKELGEDEKKAEDKLVIKKKDLEGKEGEIVILKEEQPRTIKEI